MAQLTTLMWRGEGALQSEIRGWPAGGPGSKQAKRPEAERYDVSLRGTADAGHDGKITVDELTAFRSAWKWR